MYVGLQFTQAATHQFTSPVLCSQCRYVGIACVEGVGTGQGSSPYFLDNEGAKSRAKERAIEDSIEDAKVLISIVSCKQCGHRSWFHVIVAGLRQLRKWPRVIFFGCTSIAMVALWLTGPLKRYDGLSYLPVWGMFYFLLIMAACGGIGLLAGYWVMVRADKFVVVSDANLRQVQTGQPAPNDNLSSVPKE